MTEHIDGTNDSLSNALSNTSNIGSSNNITTENSQIAGLVTEIFNDIKPALYILACRYKTPNPSDVVKSWLSRAYEIVLRFETGALTKKVYAQEDSQDELITYDPTVHSEKQFVRSLKNYLKQCFTNDLIRNFNNIKKETAHMRELGRNERSTSGFSAPSGSLMRYDVIDIDIICRIIKLDIERVRSNSASIADIIQVLFLQAMLNHCKMIISRGEPWSKLVVVPDVDEKEKKYFFSEDFKDDFEKGMRLELSRIIVAESNPLIIQRLGLLISRKNKGTLQKRIFRYFFRYRGGYPYRLKAKIQSRTL